MRREGRATSRACTLTAALLALTLGACGLPKDPNDTHERVQEERLLRAGLVRHEPWTYLQHEGKPAGPEVDAVEKLAARLGARVVWTVAPESELMHGLEKHALDLVVGGISSKTPWAKRIGLGKPFLTTRLVPGAPPGGSVPESLQGQDIAVAPGGVAGALLSKEGARVREATDLHRAPGLRAAWDWQLEAWGYVPGTKALREEQWVWVVPPGENRWLLTVDRFVLEHAEDIRRGLVDHARTRAAHVSEEIQP
nr:transporter substrate-binding domain-containing protein [Pyxidicoccus fallax]